MRNISYKWLSLGLLSYIASTIIASALLSIGVVLMFDDIEPSQLTIVEPTATIFNVAEPLIGFTVAICVAYWIASKTLSCKSNTIWFYAGALSIYGLISALLNPNDSFVFALPKLLAPWIVALLAIKWARSTQA
ncbi:hypothetical protein ACQ5ES_03610 [Pseudidiomarina sp. E22-M8]|uniref:hypothetical protein n=1 Tax=Pseudidiomarina sp. E22-M8 TaxID=3424768 RepID=UPI00403C1921